MGLKWPLNAVGFSDIQYFAVSTNVYVLSNNLGIHFVFYVLLSYIFLTGFRIYIHVVTSQNIVFFVLDSCRAMVRNGNSINSDAIEDTIKNY